MKVLGGAPVLLRAVVIVLIALVSGCDDAQDFKTYDAPPVPGRNKIMFVGNSITFHPPKQEVEWGNSNGMAASNKEHDYAHIILRFLNINEGDSYIRNFYPFETDSSVAHSHIQSLSEAFAQKPDMLVLQLGDNVRVVKSDPLSSIAQLYNFWFGYGELVVAAKESVKNVYCVSTWWRSRVKDYVIKSQCEAGGGRYIYIGDIYTDPKNPDLGKVDYSVTAVDAHPKDYGMLQIALRIKAAMGE